MYNSRFQSPGFRILQAQMSRIPESREFLMSVIAFFVSFSKEKQHIFKRAPMPSWWLGVGKQAFHVSFLESQDRAFRFHQCKELDTFVVALQ